MTRKSSGELTRRQFIKRSSAAAAAPLIGGLAAPSIVRAQDARTIRFLAPAEDVSVYVQNTIVPKFKAETGITVLVDQVEYNSLYTKEVLEFGSSTYDVYQVDQVWAQQFAKSNYLLPLDGEVAPGTLASFFPTLSKIGNVDGKQWVVPFSAIPVNFTYRKDLTAAPATWTDVLENAKRLTREASGGDQAMWGFPIRGQAGNPITWTWLPMLWSFGGDAFDADFRPIYNNEAGLEAVSFYAELYKYSPPGWLSDFAGRKLHAARSGRADDAADGVQRADVVARDVEGCRQDRLLRHAEAGDAGLDPRPLDVSASARSRPTRRMPSGSSSTSPGPTSRRRWRSLALSERRSQRSSRLRARRPSSRFYRRC